MPDGLTMSFSGNKAMMDGIEGLPEHITDLAYEKLIDAGYTGLDLANQLCPVLTGFLQSRNQLVATRDSNSATVTITNDADYAIPVVLGHHTRSGSWVDPQDFLTPAGGAMANELKSTLGGLLG